MGKELGKLTLASDGTLEPQEDFNFTDLQKRNLSNNPLNRSIPLELGNLKNLRYLQVF